MAQQVPSQRIKWEEQKFPLKVIAENIHSPSNLGMIIRTCEAFGVEEVYFTGQYGNITSAKFRKAARSSEKYLKIFTSPDTVSVIQASKIQGYKILGLEISDQSKSLANYHFPDRQSVALLIGSERHGISEVSLNLCDDWIHIQQFGITGSLNVGTALTAALYEITKQLSKKDESE